MMQDMHKVSADEVQEAEICIIGAGAAGITLALELHRQKRNAILLESGGFEREDDTEELNWGAETQPFLGDLEGARLRFFGGTTNHWGGYSAALEPEDFIARDYVEHSGWPIDHDDIVPYYKRALKVLQCPPSVIERAPARPQLVCRDLVQKFRFISPIRMGQTYRKELVDSPYIRILLHANAVGLEPDGRGVGAVRCATLKGDNFTVKAKKFVMACGTLENTRLLQFWQDSPLFDSIRDNGWLGRCFMQHPPIDLGQLYYSDRYKERMLCKRDNYEDHLAPTPEYRDKHQILNFTLGLYNDQDALWDNEVIPQYMSRLIAANDPFSVRAQVRVRTEQMPSHSNYVRLIDKRDALGVPKLQINWGLSEMDIKTIKASAQMMARAAGANSMGVMRYAEWIRENTLPDYVWGGYHHMGTTRMSNTAAKGVVDTQCRVHGVENLYVTGGGVFPTVGWPNPTFTIIALALRLADHLQIR
ncbi:MAG: GMC family oxidoreductase [Proteobacteria bacterium]|nr:GMC family oxidoreductase [Pseudomonadota bacterium]